MTKRKAVPGAPCDQCGKVHEPVSARGVPRCQKHGKRRDEAGHLVQCQQNAETGKDCCHYHGGKSLAGAASPSWKHGRYARILGVRGPLALAYRDASIDPQVRDLTEEITLNDAERRTILAELARLYRDNPGVASSGASGLDQALEGLEAVEKAISKGKAPALRAALDELKVRLAAATRIAGLHRRLADNLENGRKLKETQARIMEREGYLMPVDVLMMVLAEVEAVARRTITEAVVMRAFVTGLQDLIRQVPRPALIGRGG